MMTHHPLEGAGALLRDLAFAARSPQVSGRVAGPPVVTLPDGTTVLSGFGITALWCSGPHSGHFPERTRLDRGSTSG